MYLISRRFLKALALVRPVSDRPLLQYALAALIAGVALGLTLLFPEPRPYFLFVGAIAIASWLGGWRSGFVSFLLSALMAFFFILQPAGLPADRYAAFLATSVVVLVLTSALHHTTAALRRMNLRFGGVVQISEDAIITIDEQQNITMFNPGAEKIFGYKSEEVLGKSINILLPEKFRHMHRRHVAEFSNSGDTLRAMNERGTIAGLRKNGQEFPAEASISKFEAGGEKIMTVRLRDISERQEGERGLRELAAIVQSSQDAIIGETLEGVVTSWNSGAEKMYGYTAHEALGRHASFLLPAEAADEVTKNVQRARAGQSSMEETVRVRKDGKRLNVALTVSPIRDRNGTVVGVSTLARDITERKRLEEQLRQSQKMEAVGRLAGGVAHDFNNLLSVIVGYTYLLQSSLDPHSSLRNAAEQVMTAAEKATALTRQLLAFSRKQVLQPEVLNLNEVISSMEKMLGRLIGEDIDLRTIRSSGLKSVKADPGQIEQVIMNLAVNARDAMPEGGKLTVETANVHFDEAEARQHGVARGDYVMLAVTDTGQGMDAYTRAHMFEPFFTTKESGKGTGLGLATVYGIVNQSGGYIWVYSEPGHGTTFKIYLPAVAAEPEKEPVARRPELALCGNETILLVEDERSLRELVARVLTDRGYHVLSADNGQEALRLADEHSGEIDLLLTDVIMPRMRGQELAETLLQRYPRMALIFMSGYTDNALVHSGSIMPGTIFLQKPFTPDVVLIKVREVLDGRQPKRAVGRRA